MIVGFSRHGTGGGSGPVDYMTDPDRPGRASSPPVVLRGAPDATRDLIDSLTFRHRYTSGVLSFAPGETIPPEREQAIMDRFERVAFAGMEPDQYNILWVRHSHAGHHELHFVTPRVELSTGKSLNIRPPGDRARQAFDDFRSEINARYGLADPDDPQRARDIATPGHELKIAAEAIRRGEKPDGNIRELLDRILAQRAAEGLISDRQQLLEQVAGLGLTVTRAGKNYITVAEPESGQRWRLKGGLYERDFDPRRTLETAAAAGERDYSKPDPGAADRFARRVEHHIEYRAQYHAGRYATPDRNHVIGIQPPQKRPALESYTEPHSVPGPDSTDRLGRYLAERLGAVCMAGVPNQPELADAAAAETGARHDGREGRENSVVDVRERRGERAALPENRREAGIVRRERRKLQDTTGVLTDDRAGNPFAQRLEAAGAAIQRATARLRDRAERLAGHVRAYFTGQRDAAQASQLLEQSGQRINAAARAVQEPLQAEQDIAAQRYHARVQREKERVLEKQKQYQKDGPSLSR